MRSGRRLRIAAAVVAAMVSVGCAAGLVERQREAVRVSALAPEPRVDLERRPYPLRLELAPEVPDAFTIPEQSGITTVPVDSWHRTLRAGFEEGPARFFGGDGPAYRLRLLSVDLDYVPSALFGRGQSVSGAAAARARLRYMARVVAPNGDVVARPQGEIVSTSEWVKRGGSSRTAREVVESMYQAITRSLQALPRSSGVRGRGNRDDGAENGEVPPGGAPRVHKADPCTQSADCPEGAHCVPCGDGGVCLPNSALGVLDCGGAPK